MVGLYPHILKCSIAAFVLVCLMLQLLAMGFSSSLISRSHDGQFISALTIDDNEFDDLGNLLDPFTDESETEKDSEEETTKDESKLYELSELSTQRLFTYRNWMYGDAAMTFDSHLAKIPTPPPELA